MSASLIAAQASIGGYRHVYYLTEDRIVEALKLNFILRVPVYLAYASVKASIGAFILRIIRKRQRWQELVIWATIFVTVAVNVVACIMLFLQCSPVEVVWDPRIPGGCWDPKIQTQFGIFVTGMSSCSTRATANVDQLRILSPTSSSVSFQRPSCSS